MWQNSIQFVAHVFKKNMADETRMSYSNKCRQLESFSLTYFNQKMIPLKEDWDVRKYECKAIVPYVSTDTFLCQMYLRYQMRYLVETNFFHTTSLRSVYLPKRKTQNPN